MKLRIFLVLLVLAAQLGAIFHFSREREREAAEAPRIRLACEIPAARRQMTLGGGVLGHAFLLNFEIARAIPFSKFDAAAQATLRAKLSPLVAARMKNPAPEGSAKDAVAFDEIDARIVLKTNAESGLSEIDYVTFSEPASLAAGTVVLRTKLAGFKFGDVPAIPEKAAGNGVPANAAGLAADLPEPPPESPEDVAEKTFGFVPGDAPDESAATGLAAEIDLSKPEENPAESSPAPAAEAAPAESVPATAAASVYEAMKFSVFAEPSHALVSKKIARKIAELDEEANAGAPAEFSVEIYQRADGSICVLRVFANGEEIR